MLGFAPLSSLAISESGAALEPEGIASAPGPLGAFLGIAYITLSGIAQAESPLGAALVNGTHHAARVQVASPLGEPRAVANMPPVGFAAASGPLGAARATTLHDFSYGLGDVVTRYVMDLYPGPVRVPISSWQATLQTGASCYVQCVIPACLDWSDALAAATEFVISRIADAPTAQIEYEMARSPLGQVSMARGPTNFTATLSGYSTAFAEDEAPDAAFDRTLTDVRSITTGTSPTRVRCAIDWLLRPGQRAWYSDGASFVARYINYYVPATGDAYMDVGE
jgi:hypothetical protein